MLMAGRSVTSASDTLQKFSVEMLYHSIRNPKPHIEAMIRQLRIVYELDPKKYSAQKRALPYFVCGVFNPPFRKLDNFAYTECFIIDIDKLSCKEKQIEDVKKQIIADDRVLMCFASPSNDGLKVMFRLKERCHDKGLYSIFYKTFSREFAKSLHLEQVIDEKTSDASRACFISVDKDVYYNKDCTPVDINSYLDLDNPDELFSLKHQGDEDTKHAEVKKTETKVSADPSKDVMDKIKQRLNPKAAAVEAKRAVYVPEQLDNIMGQLCEYLNDTGLNVTDVKSIQYGKKIKAKAGTKMAEVNLFYGKRGFSVVISPKCGTDDELNEMVAQLMEQFLREN